MRFVLALSIVLLLLLPAGVRADELEQADRATDDLDFDQAAKLYREALRKPGTREQRLHAYRGLGLSLAFVGDGAGAKDAFVTMLIIDPTAKVNTSLGPKIAKPFAAAQKTVRNKKTQMKVTRDDRTGLVSAELLGGLEPIALVELHVIAAGEKEQTATVAQPGPAEISVAPHVAVKAWGAALDLGSGVIVQGGSPTALLDFPATARPPGVAAVVDEARRQNIQSEADASSEPAPVVEESGSTKWPIFAGGAAVAIAGGLTAAYFLSTPPDLRLPSADHTGRLP